MSSPTYTTTDQFTGTMNDFGRYRLTYEPPSEAFEADITMSISSDANLPQLLELFGDFLRATGYIGSEDILLLSGCVHPDALLYSYDTASDKVSPQ